MLETDPASLISADNSSIDLLTPRRAEFKLAFASSISVFRMRPISRWNASISSNRFKFAWGKNSESLSKSFLLAILGVLPSPRDARRFIIRVLCLLRAESLRLSLDTLSATSGSKSVRYKGLRVR